MGSNLFKCNIKCILYLFLVYCWEGSYRIVFGCSSFVSQYSFYAAQITTVHSIKWIYCITLLGECHSKTQVFYLLSLLQLVSGAKRTYMSTVILSAHEQHVYVTAISLSKFVRMYLQILSWFDNLQDVTYFAMTKNKGTRCCKKIKI